MCVHGEYASHTAGHRVTSHWREDTITQHGQSRITETYKWSTAERSVLENKHTHLNMHTNTEMHSPFPHSTLSQSGSTAHKANLSRTSCPIAQTVTHTYTYWQAKWTCLHIHTHTDVELINRFPKGSQEMQPIVRPWSNLPLWPEQTHGGHPGN